MNCANHEQTPAVAVCSKCERPLCESCAIHWKDAILCKRCLETGKLNAPKESRLRKSPALAAILSLGPGLGQIYVGYYMRGFVNILVVAALIAVVSSEPPGGMLPFLGMLIPFFWIFNMIDAWRRAHLYNEYLAGEEKPKLPTDSPLVGGIVLLILGIILTLSITFGLDLDFLSWIWPLAILAAGIYLVWKYRKTKREMNTVREMGVRNIGTLSRADAGAFESTEAGSLYGAEAGSLQSAKADPFESADAEPLRDTEARSRHDTEGPS